GHSDLFYFPNSFLRFQSLSFKNTRRSPVGVRFRNTEKIFGPWIRKWSTKEKKRPRSPSRPRTEGALAFSTISDGQLRPSCLSSKALSDGNAQRNVDGKR